MIVNFSLALLLQVGAAQDIDRAIAKGISDGVFPGAVVVVGTHDRVLVAKGYGHFTWSPDSRVPSADSTLYDLASVTKVVATTPAVMLLAETGQLSLDDPVSQYLPGFVGEGKDRVTIRYLLEHRSGLRAFLPLNERAQTAAEARRLVLEEPLRWSPGARVEYSDLNAMLLGWIVEAVSDTNLDGFVRQRLYDPLDMTATMFVPARNLHSNIAPVGLWRGHVIAGQLHDQNAVRLGGVSGHAGLYSTGNDLARYTQLLLNDGRTPGAERIFHPAIVRLFTQRGPGNRTLGWEALDTTSEENAGTLLSPAAFGHGGYTGTSIWIDPERDVFIIILTNRVFAPRTRRSITRLKEVRATVANTAVKLRAELCTRAPPEASARSAC